MGNSAREKSRAAVEQNMNSDTVSCVACGAIVPRKKSISDFNLRDEEGRFIRFCFDCNDKFEEALKLTEDPTGQIIPEGTVCELGQKDPFFRMRLSFGEGMPQWKAVPEGDETGGLMVFVRRLNQKQIEKIEGSGSSYRIKVRLKIINKSFNCAFAEPFKEVYQKPAVPEKEGKAETQGIEDKTV